MICEGCKEEMQECYDWQSKGYDAGLDWGKDEEDIMEHCVLFVLDREGRRIVW